MKKLQLPRHLSILCITKTMNDIKVLKNSVRTSFFKKVSREIYSSVEERSRHQYKRRRGGILVYYVLHRDGLPAYIYTDTKRTLWFAYGVNYTVTTEYCEAMQYTPEDTLLFVLKHSNELPEFIKDLP